MRGTELNWGHAPRRIGPSGLIRFFFDSDAGEKTQPNSIRRILWLGREWIRKKIIDRGRAPGLAKPCSEIGRNRERVVDGLLGEFGESEYSAKQYRREATPCLAAFSAAAQAA